MAGRPEKFPVKRQMQFDQAFLDEVEEWRREQPTIPSVAESVRRLAKKGVEAYRKEKAEKAEREGGRGGTGRRSFKPAASPKKGGE